MRYSEDIEVGVPRGGRQSHRDGGGAHRVRREVRPASLPHDDGAAERATAIEIQTMVEPVTLDVADVATSFWTAVSRVIAENPRAVVSTDVQIPVSLLR